MHLQYFSPNILVAIAIKSNSAPLSEFLTKVNQVPCYPKLVPVGLSTYVDTVLLSIEATPCPSKEFVVFSGVMVLQLSTTQALQM